MESILFSLQKKKLCENLVAATWKQRGETLEAGLS